MVLVTLLENEMAGNFRGITCDRSSGMCPRFLKFAASTLVQLVPSSAELKPTAPFLGFLCAILREPWRERMRERAPVRNLDKGACNRCYLFARFVEGSVTPSPPSVGSPSIRRTSVEHVGHFAWRSQKMLRHTEQT